MGGSLDTSAHRGNVGWLQTQFQLDFDIMVTLSSQPSSSNSEGASDLADPMEYTCRASQRKRWATQDILALANREYPSFLRPEDTTDSIDLGAGANARPANERFDNSLISARMSVPAATTQGSLSAGISAMLRIISRVQATSSEGPNTGTMSLPLLMTRLRHESTFEMAVALPMNTLFGGLTLSF